MHNVTTFVGSPSFNLGSVQIQEKIEAAKRKEETRWLVELREHRIKFIDFHKEVVKARGRINSAVRRSLNSFIAAPPPPSPREMFPLHCVNTRASQSVSH